MQQVIKSIEIENLTASEPRENKYGKLASYLLHNDDPFYLALSVYSKAPFGVNGFGENKGDPPTAFSLNISAFTAEKDDIETSKKFFESLKELDEFMINFGLEHSKKIFGKKYTKGTHDAVVDALYTRTVKTGEDKEGNQYPDRITTKIKSDYNNPIRPSAKIFTDSKTDINDENFTFDALMDLIPKGTFVKVILQPNIWFVSGRMGVSWKVIQLKTMPNSKKSKLESYGFSDDSDDDDDDDDESKTPDDDESKTPVDDKSKTPVDLTAEAVVIETTADSSDEDEV